MKSIPPHTPLLYSKTAVYRGKFIISLDTSKQFLYIWLYLNLHVHELTVKLKIAKLQLFSLAPCCQICNVTNEVSVAETVHYENMPVQYTEIFKL